MTTQPEGPDGSLQDGSGPDLATSGRPARSGRPDVDAALDQLAELDDAELAEQVAAYEQIHDRLSATINEPGDPTRPTGSR